ncbi:hypothetical protein BO85DRAFT_427732 [Aspergillus piperis CBS 112811]|uniref:CENP-V/GFA domain-containing protein n=1 Tax=Aspergillus piperis CBS 112811 TaxID=1448313 RepID=A0A8G1VIV4_9EURO|nr:hypothetical protein BO85DRAFT_427732 [Aspergillus piperis CBS 112811]RAH54035.1 hypothetical protein BO85DRAFT_427732 [Aspergillus piperis CBS 112811]
MAPAKEPEKQNSTDPSTDYCYNGSCHCRAVRFSARFPSPLSQLTVISCNCSYCHIAGSLLAFADDMEIQGTELLTEYRFATHTIQIFFCRSCGANVYNKSINPKWQYGRCAINIRLLHGIDLEAIEVTKGDGKNIRLPPLEGNPL